MGFHIINIFVNISVEISYLTLNTDIWNYWSTETNALLASFFAYPMLVATVKNKANLVDKCCWIISPSTSLHEQPIGKQYTDT